MNAHQKTNKLNPPIPTLLKNKKKKEMPFQAQTFLETWELHSVYKQKFILYTYESNTLINTIIHNVSSTGSRKLKY